MPKPTKPPGTGHDATREVSTSQLIPNERPVLHRGNADLNDMSVWGGVVVGTQDFAPPPKAKLAAPGGGKAKWLLAGAGAVAAGVIAYVIVARLAGPAAPRLRAPAPGPSAHAAMPAPAASPPAAAPAPPIPVAPAVAPAPPVLTAPAGDTVDAVSGVAPVIKSAVSKKKPARKTGKRRVVKRKPR
ncbi:MAG TPA: hypothetical protein VK427_23820 [Kofleriaceae bacterium]|nr:hypothetical protein [Kofleriaceae bacterium]